MILGAIIVLATIFGMIKRWETRMVLFCAGVLMGIVAGEPLAGFRGFSLAMKEATLFESIVAVMGFAMVIKHTGCDKHLVFLLVKILKKTGMFLIPAATMATFFINISITSAAGCSAAVGSIVIPLLMAAGIHPAVAASAVLAGTYGANYNPGYPQIMVIAEVAKTAPLSVVANHSWVLLIGGLIGAFSLLAVALLRKEHKGYVPPDGYDPKDFTVNPLRAFVPVLPLVILLASAHGWIPGLKPLAISHCMLIGVFAAFAVTRMNPGKISKEFWIGAGEGFGQVCGIIICAMVFVEGMKSLGLIKAITDAMIANTAIAKLSAAFGPFLLAVMSGSGEAASFTFNKAVTIHAADFGLNPMDMGSVVVIAGAMGRAMSPLAAGAIICAGFAGVDPLEILKRNALGMIIAVIVTMVLMLYL